MMMIKYEFTDGIRATCVSIFIRPRINCYQKNTRISVANRFGPNDASNLFTCLKSYNSNSHIEVHGSVV